MTQGTTSPSANEDTSEARRLAILECAQMVNGRLAGRKEGSDLWLEIIKITNMLARHANSDYQAVPSTLAPSRQMRKCGACHEAVILIGVDWPVWKGGAPICANCFAAPSAIEEPRK